MIILIPAYEPDARLVSLVRDLHRAAPECTVLVVDDGSGPRYSQVFAAATRAGAEVIGYASNRGKGHALKAGFAHILERFPDRDVVCADSDGQHRVDDIMRVAARIDTRVVLGGRRFTGDVPRRSRVGNAISRQVFRLATGLAIHDTQTGLRGYPAALVPWALTVEGERFEYELTLLLRAPAAGVQVDEIEIATVYLDDNASSHFRPVVDSVRVFAPLIRYSLSSLAAFAVDAAGLVVLYALTSSLLVSVLGARIVSASVNFLVNRHVVFSAGGSLRRDALRYATLALALVASSYVWLLVLTQWGVPLIAAKLLTDVTLYLVGFQVQRRFVFRRKKAAKAPSAQFLLRHDDALENHDDAGGDGNGNERAWQAKQGATSQG